MKKILILFLFFTSSFYAATPDCDPTENWWHNECFHRMQPPVITESESESEDNQDFYINNTCLAGSAILNLLKNAKRSLTQEDPPQENAPQEDVTQDENDEWENTVKSAHLVTPPQPDQPSNESTVLGKIITGIDLSLLGELHMARTLYTKPTQEEAKKKRKVIKSMANNQSLFDKSQSIRNTYSSTVETATEIYRQDSRIIEGICWSQWQLDLLGTGKVLGCARIVPAYLFPTITVLNSAYNLPVSGFNQIIALINTDPTKLASSTWASLKNLHKITSNYSKLYNAILIKDIDRLIPAYTANHTLLKAAYSITQLAEEYPELKNIQSFTNVQRLEERMSSNKELTECIELLKSDPNDWWTHNKEVLVTLLDKYKNELAGIYDLVGEFESYVALAEIKKKLDSEGHPVTFSQFTQSKVPSLSIKKFWNPLLNPEKAVTNSLQMGGDLNTFRHMILTGANMSGKSKLLETVIANTVFSQTYGVAFARTMEHTYFDQVLSSKNINYNSTDGDSPFVSEVKHAKNILKRREKGNSLIVCNELFKGTSSQDATSATTKVLTQLSKNPNTLSLLATHHPAVTNLGTLLPFKNYKMDVTRLENGEIRYTYKLRAGINTETTAGDILQELLDL